MSQEPASPADQAGGAWVSPFQTVLGSGPIVEADPVIGTPDQDAQAQEPAQQTYPDDCAIRCQEFIIHQFTGQDPGEDALVQEAAQHGWYDHGTAPADVGNLLELHGIDVNRYANANIFNLTAELAQGHKVIVGVDSSELWYDHPGTSTDHAVVVSGIDTRDPQHTMVVVTDPGTGDAEKEYPLERFLAAWRDGHFMVATHDPAPPSAPEMANFDYGLGHIPEVAGVPYQQFMQLEYRPELARDMLEAHQAEPESGLGALAHDALSSVQHLLGLASPAEHGFGAVLHMLLPGSAESDHHSGPPHVDPHAEWTHPADVHDHAGMDAPSDHPHDPGAYHDPGAHDVYPDHSDDTGF